ncbi:MAG: ABC transporter ATP-binding protein [Spirochaetia bacterium]|jgi:simple sugar transport system ATP-binding protein|nr:ABC transporter ATP-binding protein [Spirochaetia bacterium]
MVSSVIPEQPILETHRITKQFPRVLANDDISIRLHKGEILSILGENGAGKSTLMNILYGLYRPTSGKIILKGKETSFSSPRDAIGAGLGMVHQHFMLVETLTVTENIILGSEPSRGGIIDYQLAKKQVLEISDLYGLHVDPDERIENLPVGLQQRVEILKALYRHAEILILDEPTAVLTPQEVEELFRVILALRGKGVSIIIITHKLEEVIAISDRVYILRRGKLSGEGDIKDLTKESLANMMVGRDVVLRVLKKDYEETKYDDKKESVFSIENLTVLKKGSQPILRDITFNVLPGEIVGIAGVDGNGQSELSQAVMGLIKIDSGSIILNEKEISKLTTKQRIARGISYVPADRQRDGLVLEMSVSENIIIGRHDRKPFVKSAGRINHQEIKNYAQKLTSDFDIRTPSVSVSSGALSGGNQQKVILAREFSRSPLFLLLNQPTRGLDVGAIEYIHSRIMEMKEKGAAILLVSLELEEIFALSDRILVIYEGAIVTELKTEDTTDNEVGLYMTGGWNK